MERVTRGGPNEGWMTVADLSRVFATEGRVSILRLLAECPLDVTTLADRLGHSISFVSKHLSALRDLDLVWHVREGKRHIFELSDRVSVSVADGEESWTLTAAGRCSATIRLPGPSGIIIRPGGGDPEGRGCEPSAPPFRSNGRV